MGKRKRSTFKQYESERLENVSEDSTPTATVERELEFTPEAGLILEKVLIDTFLDRMIAYADEAIGKAKQRVKESKTIANENTLRYWTNVKGGYRWAKEMNAQRSK